ncbi:MAG: hypothetical protein SVR08_16085 [Spirochaetota bacterium]|nr:hypothetical protein [Spirochaetota bacterium]
MGQFILAIDIEIFKKTNGPWNELRLNDPWNVGYVSSLIEMDHFQNKELWEDFYYNSGKERNQQLITISNDIRILLNDHTLKLTNPQRIEKLSWDLKNLNY